MPRQGKEALSAEAVQTPTSKARVRKCCWSMSSCCLEQLQTSGGQQKSVRWHCAFRVFGPFICSGSDHVLSVLPLPFFLQLPARVLPPLRSILWALKKRAKWEHPLLPDSSLPPSSLV